jgi:cytochrome P450
MPKPAEDPLRFLAGVQQAFGGRSPPVRVVPAVADSVSVVLDPELVRGILADRDRFRRPDAAPAGRRQGLLSSDGALWERQRSVLRPEFVGERLSTFADAASSVVADLLADWPGAVASTSWRSCRS